MNSLDDIVQRLQSVGLPEPRAISPQEVARYDGQVFVHRSTTEGVVVERADPMVRIAGEIVRNPRGLFDVEVTGNAFRILAANAPIVYRLDAFDPDRDIYLASQPD
jgi:hypothetical protein